MTTQPFGTSGYSRHLRILVARLYEIAQLLLDDGWECVAVAIPQSTQFMTYPDEQDRSRLIEEFHVRKRRVGRAAGEEDSHMFIPMTFLDMSNEDILVQWKMSRMERKHDQLKREISKAEQEVEFRQRQLKNHQKHVGEALTDLEQTRAALEAFEAQQALGGMVDTTPPKG